MLCAFMFETECLNAGQCTGVNNNNTCQILLRHLTSSLVTFLLLLLLLWCGEDEVLSYLLDYEIYSARKDKLSAEKIPDDLDLRSRSIQQALIDRRSKW